MTSNNPFMRVDSHFIDRLVRGICHDIGAPTRHVIQFTQMLNQDGADRHLDEKHQRWLSLVTESGQKIQNMLSSMTELSRLSAYTEKSDIELRDLFIEQLTLKKEKYRANDCRIEINDEWPTIVGYQEHWRLLFSHLLDNALVFHPKKSDIPHIIQLGATCRIIDSEVEFILNDNGIGMTELQRKEITRAFKRLNSLDEYPGIGMGLTYCDFIAELNGGSLDFHESSLGGLQVIYKQPIEDVNNVS